MFVCFFYYPFLFLSFFIDFFSSSVHFCTVSLFFLLVSIIFFLLSTFFFLLSVIIFNCYFYHSYSRHFFQISFSFYGTVSPECYLYYSLNFSISSYLLIFLQISFIILPFLPLSFASSEVPPACLLICVSVPRLAFGSSSYRFPLSNPHSGVQWRQMTFFFYH